MDICTITGITSSCLLPALEVVSPQVPQTCPWCCQLASPEFLGGPEPEILLCQMWNWWIHYHWQWSNLKKVLFFFPIWGRNELFHRHDTLFFVCFPTSVIFVAELLVSRLIICYFNGICKCNHWNKKGNNCHWSIMYLILEKCPLTAFWLVFFFLLMKSVYDFHLGIVKC